MAAELFAALGSATSPVTAALLVIVVLPLTITVTLLDIRLSTVWLARVEPMSF
jgi:hypothetical protein